MVKLWEIYPHIWKTKSEYFVWLRGRLRSIWSDFPVRKDWKNKHLTPVTEELRRSLKLSKQTKRIGQCALCSNWFAGSHLECDHIVESEGCHDFETAQKFLWHCAGQDASNFQLVCKPCHKIKNHSQRMGLGFEEARLEKQVIQISKLPVTEIKAWLTSKGCTPATNAAARRKQIKEVLENEQNN